MKSLTVGTALRTTAALAPLVLVLSACATDPGGGTSAARGPITVEASDDACSVSATKLEAGPSTFTVTNTGSKATEFYVYAEGDKIMGEVENIGPGLSRDLVVDLPAGTYAGVCKPGMVGDGIRQQITVSGEAAASLSGSAKLTSAADSYSAYVRSQTGGLIGPVAETFGDLDPLIDEREPDVEPGTDFTGFHRIKKQLWVSGNTKGMGPVADQLLTNVHEVVAKAKERPLTALEMAQGSKALLNEVATTKISGEEEGFSHTDLWDFKANLEGAEAAIAALRPVVEEREPALAEQIEQRFAAVSKELRRHRRPDDTLISYDQLSQAQVRAVRRGGGAQ